MKNTNDNRTLGKIRIIRNYLLISIFLALTIGIKSGFAQSRISGGIRAGVAASNFYGADVSGANKFIAPRVGIYLNYSVTNWFSVQPELSINSEGMNHSMMMNKFPYKKARVTYLQIPFLLKLSSNSDWLINNFKPSFFIGPAPKLMVFKSITGKRLEGVKGGYSINQRAKQTAFDLVGGIGGTINSLYTVDLRLNYGLTPTFEDGDVQSVSIALTIGFKF